MQSQLQDAKRQLETARRAANQPPATPPPEGQVPIRWAPGFQSNYNSEKQIIWIRFNGEATALAPIKDAYITSNITGHRERLKVWNQPSQKRWDTNQIEPIPAGANVILILDLAPPLSVGDFLSQWGAFEFHVIYSDNKEYTEFIDQGDVEQQLRSLGLFGPHVTPKDDK